MNFDLEYRERILGWIEQKESLLYVRKEEDEKPAEF